MSIIKIILNVLMIIIWMFIMSYIIKLEKIGCECSQDWRRDFIKYYIIFIIIVLFLSSVDIWNLKYIPPIVSTIQFGSMMLFIGIVYHYIHELKRKKCECSEDLARDILEIINYIQLFVLIFTVLVMIYFMMVLNKMNLKIK